MANNFHLDTNFLCKYIVCELLSISLFCSYLQLYTLLEKQEDLKVLKRSPDLLNNVKIGHGQLQLIM